MRVAETAENDFYDFRKDNGFRPCNISLTSQLIQNTGCTIQLLEWKWKWKVNFISKNASFIFQIFFIDLNIPFVNC